MSDKTEKRKHLILFLLMAVVLGLAVGQLALKNKTMSAVSSTAAFPVTIVDNNIEKQAESMITVEIYGAVEKDGSFTLPGNGRLADLLWLCGVKEEANLANLSMAKCLTNQDRIFIPYTDESKNKELLIGTWADYSIDSVITADEKSNIASSEQNTEKIDKDEIEYTLGKINVNTASLKELMTLPGIGEVKGQAIIEYREKVGFFSKVEDLDNVKGIGGATLESIKDYIIFEE